MVLQVSCTWIIRNIFVDVYRDDDDANDDPDYQQPASVSQKDDDMEDEDDKVTVHTTIMYSSFTVSN